MPPKPKEAPPVEPPAPSEREVCFVLRASALTHRLEESILQLERRKETREVIEQSFQDIDSLVWSQERLLIMPCTTS
jgi:hypothetical protein